MQDLKVTLVQADQYWEKKEINLMHFEELLANAEQTDLVLLPEMFHTGFTMNAPEMAEETEGSQAVSWLKKQAAKMNAAIYTSFIAVEGGKHHNRGIFVRPDGSFELYDKRKCFGLAGETAVYTAGTAETIVEYKGWKINLQICYDLRFPENCRNSLDANGDPRYDVLLYVANWPERRIAHWNALLPARAIENQCYVAAVNRVGADANDLAYNGMSAVISPMGETVSNLRENSESTECVTLPAETLAATRERLPFLRDSAPDRG
jgi:omega-amidase